MHKELSWYKRNSLKKGYKYVISKYEQSLFKCCLRCTKPTCIMTSYLRDTEDCVTLCVDCIFRVQFDGCIVIWWDSPAIAQPFHRGCRLTAKPQVIPARTNHDVLPYNYVKMLFKTLKLYKLLIFFSYLHRSYRLIG